MTDQHQNSTSQPAESTPAPERKKKTSSGKFILIIPLIVVILITLLNRPGDIAWQPDLETARQQARQLKKPLMLSFDWATAPHCIKMKRNTYSDEKVIAFVQENFVPVRIDYDTQQDLFKKYDIVIYPTQVIQFPGRDNFTTVPGYHPPDNFIPRLKAALKKLK